jgi:tryptophan synthase alpha chain
MNRINAIFGDLRAGGRRGLMPFICGGWPRAGVVGAVLPALERAGASIVEIGIPFSDPVADGPVIAAAMHEALKAGATPETVFAEVAGVRGKLKIGLVAMVSVSIVQRMGGGRGFARLAADAGFDGVIYPDAPLDEAGELLRGAAEAGLAGTLLVAPTTPPERARRIAEACTGFIYLLARAGITGESAEVADVSGPVERLRSITALPIACGFGISTADHVRAVVRHADAAIVGSALVRRMGGSDPVGEAERFTRELAAGLA